jgi:excisionase family DNA binding protein
MDCMTRQIPTIPTQEKITLRINETVAVSGLSRSTIYELLKAGKLRAVKIGGRRLILRESLQALLHGGIQ